MVMLTGTQEIPSALLDLYRGTLTEKQPDGTSRKRYPYRLPGMQAGGSYIKPKQIIQRNRFKAVIAKFNATSAAERARWYAARPPWSSFLWYYNYFMMSGLMDVLGANPEGASVINTIKHYPFTLPQGAAANVTVNISEVDPSKAMGFFYGAGHYEEEAFAYNVYPYLVTIAATYAIVKAAGLISFAAGCSISIIEYI